METPPRFYGLPKVHKEGTPLRPIVSSIDSISYNCARYVADLLAPLVGRSEHHIKNSQHFADIIQHKTIGEDEELVSYDVTALFTSVPVKEALTIIRRRLEEDEKLKHRTKLSPDNIITLLELCVSCTYFVYDGTFFKQIHGTAMGSPVSPILCNLFMEDFEKQALASAPHPPAWWYRYVDDTHTKQKKCHADEFLSHINSINSHIKFTTERETNGSLAFLDCMTSKRNDGSIKVTIYRKPTHTDQYLAFSSNHPLEHKVSVIRTLYHRAQTVVTEENDKESEFQHVKSALKKCGYPDWTLKQVLNKGNAPENRSETQTRSKSKHPPIVIPFMKGLSYALRRTFDKFGIRTYFKPQNTLRQIIGSPKDKLDPLDTCGPIYLIQCEGDGTTKCHHSYVGETERSLRARVAEHLRPSSVNSEVSRHINKDYPSHQVHVKEVRILSREKHWFERGIKEAIQIRTHQPTLNRDGGRYQLPHIWDSLLTSKTVNTINRETTCEQGYEK